MRAVRRAAAIGSATFFVVSPGVELVLGPWVLTGFERGDGLPDAGAIRALGALLLVAGAAVVLVAYVRFAADGRGTPSPAAPPRGLVVTGPYCYVRNPMYLGTAAAIVGEALLLSQPVLLLAAAAYGCALAAWVRLREEPLLAERLGADYEAYRREVPGWRPRLRRWRGA